ncbi:hypothetical protein [Streptomyces sp. NPDC056683]
MDARLRHRVGAVFVDAVRPAAEVVRTIAEEAEAILASRPRSLLG